MDKEYRFCYNGTKEMFINHCRYGSPDKRISINPKGDFQIENYIISTIDNKLKFGIERTGHSGGNWYIPEIVEYDNRIELVTCTITDGSTGSNTTFKAKRERHLSLIS